MNPMPGRPRDLSEHSSASASTMALAAANGWKAWRRMTAAKSPRSQRRQVGHTDDVLVSRLVQLHCVAIPPQQTELRYRMVTTQ